MRYLVEILKGKEFQYTKYKNHRRGIVVQDRKDTAIVKIEYENGEKVTLEYGYIEAEEVYEMIRNKVEVNLNRTYIKNFKYSKVRDNSKKIIGFSAYYAFFDGDTDFSCAEFCSGDVNFSHIIFGIGDVSFYQTNFGDGDVYFHKSNFTNGNVDFYSSNFGNGNVDFKFTNFGKGHIDFNNTNFGDGDVFFNGSHFGDGDVYFRRTSFGNGQVDFHSATFGKGNIYFNNANFGDGNLDFYHTSFGEGCVDFDNAHFGQVKVDFRQVIFDKGDVNFSNITLEKGSADFSHIIFGEGNVNFGNMTFNEGEVDFNNTFFGNGNVDFSGTVFRKGNVIFSNAKFGYGEINFSKINFGEEKVDLSNISFAGGRLSFEYSYAKYLIFDNCIFNDYCDMRLVKCEYLSLNNCTFKDVFDMQKDEKYEVEIDTISIINAKNLGQIYLDWEANSVKKMICDQKHFDDKGNKQDTSNKQKLEQFRLLKENFRNLGRYEDEDKAYVEFKKHERLYNNDCSNVKKGKFLSRVRLRYYEIRIRKFIKNGLNLIILDKIGGYGTRPENILIAMLTTIALFTGIYSLFPKMICLTDNINIVGTIPRAFYLSVETFLTIGYGNISPANNYSIVLAAMEGFMGVFLMAYFTIAFVRKILR